VLFLQSLQKLFLFRQWRGYKSDGLKLKTQEPYFQVKRCSEIFEGDLSCQITVRSSDAQESCSYKLEALSGKLAFKITNSNGEIVAEVRFCISLKCQFTIWDSVIYYIVQSLLILCHRQCY
jgi:hypothetical protein